MRKVSLGLATLIIAGGVTLPVSGTETLLRKTGASDRSFESFLPPANVGVPWLTIDRRTRLPKGDYPIGRNAEVAPLILKSPHLQHADMAALALGGG